MDRSQSASTPMSRTCSGGWRLMPDKESLSVVSSWWWWAVPSPITQSLMGSNGACCFHPSFLNQQGSPATHLRRDRISARLLHYKFTGERIRRFCNVLYSHGHSKIKYNTRDMLHKAANSCCDIDFNLGIQLKLVCDWFWLIQWPHQLHTKHPQSNADEFCETLFLCCGLGIRNI